MCDRVLDLFLLRGLCVFVCFLVGCSLRLSNSLFSMFSLRVMTTTNDHEASFRRMKLSLQTLYRSERELVLLVTGPLRLFASVLYCLLFCLLSICAVHYVEMILILKIEPLNFVCRVVHSTLICSVR